MNNQQIVKAIQNRLLDLGYYKGYSDGIIGVMTNNAVVDFKRNNGLLARDFVGKITLGKLFSKKALARPTPPNDSGKTPWIVEARRLMGVKEIPGPRNNPGIMKWAIDLDLWYPGDDTAWCGLFIAHIMAVGAPDEPQGGFNRLAARQWLKYGVDAGTVPLIGAIAPMWRTHKTKSWHGHVVTVTGYNDTHIRGIGGNQHDMVSEAWFTRSRVLGYRKPEGFDLDPAPYTTTGNLSKREN